MMTMAIKVNVRGVDVNVRSLTLTRHLIKQCRVFKGTPAEPFCKSTDITGQGGWRVEVLPEFAVAWFRGSVLDEEYDDFVLFAKDGDLFLGKMSRSINRWKLPTTCKQVYIA
jgi:hypothetical protein